MNEFDLTDKDVQELFAISEDDEYQPPAKSEWELSSEAERAEKGWSSWDMLAIGFDNWLLPQVAHSLLAIAGDNAEMIKAAHLMELCDDTHEWDGDMNSDPDWFNNSYRPFETKRMHKVAEGLRWLSNHFDEVKNTPMLVSGRPMDVVLGEALVYFGTYDLHSFPGRGPYSGYLDSGEYDEEASNAAFERWRDHCVWAGLALRSTNHMDRLVAIKWLAQWYSSLWD